jgi:hypothetical protein
MEGVKDSCVLVRAFDINNFLFIFYSLESVKFSLILAAITDLIDDQCHCIINSKKLLS